MAALMRLDLARLALIAGVFALIGGMGRPFRAGDNRLARSQGVALGWYKAAPLALVMVVFGFFIGCLDEA